MANEFIIRKGYKSLANSEITGSLNVTVDITGSAFKGDGSALTGVTAEWDGSHTGNASITGDLSAQGFHIDGASLETYHDFQSKPIDTDSGLFTIGGHGMQNGYTRALSLWSSTDGVWNSWIGTNLRWDGTNFKRASNNGGQNWGNVSGIRFLGNSATTGASMQFVVNPPAQTSAPSGEQTVGTAVPSSWTALSIDNDKKVTTHGALTSLGDANFNGYLQAHSTFYVRSIIQVMNKAANGFLTLGNRNTSGTEVVYDLGYIGTITAAGKIQGAELEGTSLDINGNADISGNLSGVDTLTATTLSVTNYGLVSGDIPNNAANTTGNADTSTTAGSAAKLTDGGSLTSQPGQNNLIHTGQINAGTSGLFATSDNSNSVITLNRHSGNYDSQLGFSSNGNLYYRKFSNSTAFTTQTWKQLAFTDSNITGNAATVTTNANLTGHVTSVGNATSLGSFTTAELNAAISDGSINIPQTLPTDFVSAANGGTFSGTVTINKDGDALNLRSVTNGQPTNLTFSTNVPDSQIGHIKYTHSNSASYGSGEAFIIGGTESSTTIFADGKLMYAEGIYSKPSSGTGAGTRRDSNWNTAYTHSQATHAPTDAEANVQADWNATSGDALILNKPSIPAASGKGQNINYIQSNLPSSDTTYRDNFGAGVWAYSGYSTGSDRPTTYDATLQVMPTANLGFEISTGWHSTGEGKIKIRALRDCCEGWGSYYDVWTSANFTPSSFISATSADTASELITFSKGISSDGDAKFYNWRALDNTSNSTDFCHRIARITGTQSTRFVIEIAGRQSSYSDNSFPAFGKIVGQLNNDQNYDITFYNFTIGTEVEAVLEVGQLDVNTTQTDIYIRHGQYAELTATAHISDGSITTYSNDSGATGTPVGYVQSSEVEVWNSSNDGSGSGMDADFVDGFHASSFMRSDANDTASGTYTFTGSAKFALDSTFANSEVRLPATTDQNPTMMFYRPTGAAAASYPWRFQAGGGGSSSSFYIGTGSGANNGSETIANKLSISSTGTLTVSGDVIAYGSPSDAKYKENVKPIENALGKVMDLEGVSFDWKENSEILDIKEDIGFIAQDVQKVIPELVKENEDGNLSLRYQGLIPVLLEAMKEQQKQIDELKSQMAVSNKRACNCKK
jgi:hypothetical protein